MNYVSERAATASTGDSPSECSQLGGGNVSNNRESPARRQEGICLLHREFVVEALRVVAVKASHAADELELGDDVCAARTIEIAVAHIREAAKSFREFVEARP